MMKTRPSARSTRSRRSFSIADRSAAEATAAARRQSNTRRWPGGTPSHPIAFALIVIAASPIARIRPIFPSWSPRARTEGKTAHFRAGPTVCATIWPMTEGLSKEDVTGLLRRWREDGVADDRLIRAVEWELRRIAAGYMRRERPDHTLQ